MVNAREINNIVPSFNQTIFLPHIVYEIINNFYQPFFAYFDGHIRVEDFEVYRLNMFHTELGYILSFVERLIHRIIFMNPTDPPLNPMDYFYRYVNLFVLYTWLDMIYFTTSRIENIRLRPRRMRRNNHPLVGVRLIDLGRNNHRRLLQASETIITYMRSIEPILQANFPNFGPFPPQWFEQYR